MSDIVERLRRMAQTLREMFMPSAAADVDEAADEITRLRDRIAHLERVVAAADDLRDWASVEHMQGGAHVHSFPQGKCPLCKSVARYDAVRKEEG